MNNVMKCPNCGAEVFDSNGSGVQECEYCHSNVDFSNANVQQNSSNPDQNMTADGVEADVQELRRKWIANIRSAMIIHAAIIMFSCIVSHFGSGVAGFVAGCVILMIDFVYAIGIATKLALSVVRPNMTTTTIIKVITVIVFYALFFIEYVAAYTAISTILAFFK